MKIDLAGPERRGLAMGLNEAAGYGAVAATAAATGWLAARYGLRPAPFLLGMAFVALGLGLSTVAVRETRGHAHHEAAQADERSGADATTSTPSTRVVFATTTLHDRALSAVTQAGFVNNLNDGLAWGVFPILFARHGLTTGTIGLLVALYPAVWGVGQLVTGPLSDRWGRKPLIVAGMLTQAVALGGVAAATGLPAWAAATALLGAGTAMVYPTLLAAVGDVAHPRWRASAVGVYRLWRDMGFAAGALVAGVVADLAGIRAAVWVVAAMTAASGAVVAVRMYETGAKRPVRVPVAPAIHG